MLSESLAVIGHDGNNRVLVQAPGLEPGDEFSNRGIGIGDFSIVRIGSKAGLVWLRRLIRSVRVVAMHPHEDRSERMFAEPCERTIHHFTGTPFNAVIAIFAKTSAMKAGVIGIESSIKTNSCDVLGIQHHRSDKRSRVIATAVQDFG